MNTKIIIYDDSCPLCAAYTSGFVKAGFIDTHGRQSFSNVAPALLQQIDQQRSVNEIPVIDTTTNTVWYGIDALLEILQQKIPFAKPIGNIKPIKWLLQKLYKFISYNRRIIVAGKATAGNFDCTPTFNAPYRLIFLAVFLIINTLLLFPFHQYILANSIFNKVTAQQLQAVHFMLVGTNIIIALLLNKKEAFDYLGQINMLALTAILVAIPLCIINKYAGLSNNQHNSFFLGMLTLFTILEYRRRIRFIDFFQQHSPVVFANIACAVALLVYLSHPF